MIAYVDGGCWPNPGGPATWGWLIERDTGARVATGSGTIPPHPNNTSFVAEYEALVRVLERARLNGIRLREVYSDSNVVVRQVKGEYKCNAPHLRPRCERARELLAESRASIRWIPRDENDPADALTRERPRAAPQDDRRADETKGEHPPVPGAPWLRYGPYDPANPRPIRRGGGEGEAAAGGGAR